MSVGRKKLSVCQNNVAAFSCCAIAVVRRVRRGMKLSFFFPCTLVFQKFRFALGLLCVFVLSLTNARGCCEQM